MNQSSRTPSAAGPRVAARMAGIQSFHVMELLARAQQLQAAGRDVVHMEVGEPDFATPPAVVEAAKRALDAGLTGYSPALGIPELRRAVAAFYADHFGVEVAPERIAITPGASGALQLALGVTVDPGRQVLMADPGYPCNRHFVRMFGGEAVEIPAGADSGYQLTAALAAANWSGDVASVMVATPSNPTGTTLAAEELDALAALCRDRGAWLLVDEIYAGLSYDRAPQTVIGRNESALAADVDRLAQNVFLCPSRVAQHAALAAFEPATLERVEAHRRAFGERRDFLLGALRDLGFGIPVTPAGAFYLYADCSRFTDDSYGFCWDLLERAGVAITPGRDFGSYRAERHVRFAYTVGIERLAVGVERIRQYLAAGG